MIKKTIGQQNEDEASGRDTSSLIDVGFLILIGFVLAAILVPREGDLGMTLAKAPENASEPEFGFDRMEPDLDVPRAAGEGGAPLLRAKVDDAVSAQRFTCAAVSPKSICVASLSSVLRTDDRIYLVG